VDCLLRPPDLADFSWYVRIRSVPDAETENEVLIGMLKSGTHVARTASPQKGVYTLFMGILSGPRVVDSRILYSSVAVRRESRNIGSDQARDWLSRLFKATADTPIAMLNDAQIARDKPPDQVLLHATTYIIDFKDYALRSKMSLVGPRSPAGATLPAAHEMLSIQQEIESLFHKQRQ
jgi:hypothetical protein